MGLTTLFSPTTEGRGGGAIDARTGIAELFRVDDEGVTTMLNDALRHPKTWTWVKRSFGASMSTTSDVPYGNSRSPPRIHGH